MVNEELRQHLLQHISPDDSVVLVHAATWTFLRPEIDIDSYLDTLLSAIGDDQTLIMPTFTFSFTKTGHYDVQRTKSEVGDLSNAFLRRGAVRGRHPIYSFAALGLKAEEIISKWGSTCFGEGSTFEYLEKVNARIVMLGATMTDHCTLHHRAEEIARVPYRYFKTFRGVVTDGGECQQEVEVRFFVRRLDLPTEYDFREAVERLKERPSYKITNFGRGTIESALARDVMETALDTLSKDIYSPLLHRRRVRTMLEGTPLRLLGAANLSILEKDVQSELIKRNIDQYCVRESAFGQYAQYALDKSSALYRENPGEVFLLVRIEDLLGSYIERCWLDQQEISWQIIEERMETYAATIETLRGNYRGEITVADFGFTMQPRDGLADTWSSTSLEKIEDVCNRFLEERVFQRYPDISKFPYRKHLHAFGVNNTRPGKYWYLGRIPFSPSFSRYLTARIVEFLLIKRRKVAKAVVVDLDNTLWGGVLGDVGEGGISLGGDYPGNIYQHVQRFLKGLSQRGIALAICSKNQEDFALKVIESHPEMVLRLEDIATYRINWENKADNVRAIAEELNIGLDSVCFLDDNPNERELVRHFLPEVIVPELPTDVAEWVDFLTDQYYLNVYRLTQEDMNRRETFKTLVAVQKLRKEAVDLDDFLRSLRMKAHFEKLSEQNQERIVQLFQKTNQFNATTRRHTLKDLHEICEKGGAVYGVRTSGKFDPSEVNAAFTLLWENMGEEKALYIESLLYSCRMAGRKLENAIVAFIHDLARQNGARYLIGEICETERNAPIRGLYRSLGFAPASGGRFVLDVTQSAITSPDCFEVSHE